MKKILLVDDSTTTQKLISITLANEPYQIESIMDSKKALEIINRRNPDIVMVDINMPGMNGFELCREIKARPSTSSIRVILLFGVFDEVNDNQTKSVGADATLIKPFETKSLLEVLSSIYLDAPKHLSPNSLTSLDTDLEDASPSVSKNKFDIDELWLDEMKPTNTQEILQGWKLESLQAKNTKRGSRKEELPAQSFSSPSSLDQSKIDPSQITKLLESPEFRSLIQAEVNAKIEKILWEVIPVTANTVIKSELQRLLSEI